MEVQAPKSSCYRVASDPTILCSPKIACGEGNDYAKPTRWSPSQIVAWVRCTRDIAPDHTLSYGRLDKVDTTWTQLAGCCLCAVLPTYARKCDCCEVTAPEWRVDFLQRGRTSSVQLLLKALQILVTDACDECSPVYARPLQELNHTLDMSICHQASWRISEKPRITILTPFSGSLSRARTQRMLLYRYG